MLAWHITTLQHLSNSSLESASLVRRSIVCRPPACTSSEGSSGTEQARQTASIVGCVDGSGVSSDNGFQKAVTVVASPAMALRKVRLTRLSRDHAGPLSPSAASARRAITVHSSGGTLSRVSRKGWSSGWASGWGRGGSTSITRPAVDGLSAILLEERSLLALQHKPRSLPMFEPT